MSWKDGGPPDHTHCVVCGRAIPVGSNFCSQECERGFLSQRRRQRLTTWIFLGGLLVLMVLWVFLSGRTSR